MTLRQRVARVRSTKRTSHYFNRTSTVVADWRTSGHLDTPVFSVRLRWAISCERRLWPLQIRVRVQQCRVSVNPLCIGAIELGADVDGVSDQLDYRRRLTSIGFPLCKYFLVVLV